jgi:hypothetical protein
MKGSGEPDEDDNDDSGNGSLASEISHQNHIKKFWTLPRAIKGGNVFRSLRRVKWPQFKPSRSHQQLNEPLI